MNRMSGHDRALLYRLALETGFRWSELYSLTRASFDFESTPALVMIKAEDAKNRKDDFLPLRKELASDMKVHLASALPTDKAFPTMRQEKGADMFRADLEAAGIPVVDDNGRVLDFHSLRHTFGTFLNRARVPLATAQKLMRHSDPKLTANIYTHVIVQDKAEALALLPTMEAVEKAQVPPSPPTAKKHRSRKLRV